MSQPTAESAKRSSVFDHPVGFWFFFWGEFAERCCYYGMRAILLLYMIQILKFSDSSANRVMSYFIASCYLLPLIGGYVADNFLGKYRTIVYFAIPYILGQALLGIASLHNETCLYLSLGLLAMGSGVIKPNISTLMGSTYDQRRPGQTKLRSDAFAMFYGSINIGAALSSFFVPAIRNYYGGDSRAYAIAFLFPAVLMMVSFVVFAAGKPFYATETIRRVRLTPAERRERLVVLRRLFGLFFVVMIFWSIFDQSASTWTLFARDHLHLRLFGLPLSPDQLQAVNPILILLLLPPITMLWHLLARWGWDLRPTSKMLIGFSLATITMAITAWAAFRGADAITAGAPTVLAEAEKAASSFAVAENDSASEIAAKKWIDAASAGLGAADLPKAEKNAAMAAAEEAKEAAERAARDVGPDIVAVATARHAAMAAMCAAKAASEKARDEPGDISDDASRKDVLKEAVGSAKAASEAVNEAVRLANAVARDGDPKKLAKSQAALTVCSVVANRTSAAAAAAKSADEAAVAKNHRAAQVNAAVAAANAADATVAAANAIAAIENAATPAAVEKVGAATAAARISLWWQVIPYILITMAEVCISVVGLELAFTAAPAAMKSFVTACWLLTVFFGNILNAQVTPLYNETFGGISLTPNWYFLMFALLMVPVTLAFAVVARRFNQSAPVS
jgi:dipeptide/tripeptide permease